MSDILISTILPLRKLVLQMILLLLLLAVNFKKLLDNKVTAMVTGHSAFSNYAYKLIVLLINSCIYSFSAAPY